MDRIFFNPDPRQILERKELQDGSELQLRTWVSDVIQPGRRGYQLALNYRSGLIAQHPTDWENYSEAQIRKMYSSVERVEDFEKLRYEG
ncbi:MAG: hypothetical protein ABH864_04865 [archaeon]